MGVLGSLNIPELEYSMLLKEYDLLNYIKSKIYPGNIKQVFLKYFVDSHLKACPLATLLTLSVSGSSSIDTLFINALILSNPQQEQQKMTLCLK